MARLGITARKRPYALSLACLWMAACTGGSFGTLSPNAPDEQGRPPDEPAANQEPNEDRPGGELVENEGPVEMPAPNTEDERDGTCRALVRRGDEVVLASASGEERLIDRHASWDKSFGQVWAIGEHAIVGVPDTDDFRGGQPPIAAFALVHAGSGVLWRGTAPAGDYIRATGFHSLTREGYAVLSDDRVVDPTGTEHSIPEEGFVPVGASIDQDGYLMVARAGELAYWNVRAAELDMSVTAALGLAITNPSQLGGLPGVDAAFVEEVAAGQLAFTRVSRNEVERAALTTELADRLRERLPAMNEEFESVATRELDDAVLLVVDHRPAAWAGTNETPHTFDAWSTLPIAREVQAAGGCFTGAPVAASSADELVASLWRVHTGTGELEMGLRFAVPGGFSLVVPEDAYTFPLPVCAGEGRMAVMLSGPDGFAWFSEGDTGFEQLTPWGEQTSFLPLDTPSTEQPHRILGPFHWYPPIDGDDCELTYDENGGLLLLDHTRNLELPLAADANAALLGR
jgi:hypothetical protein